MDSNWVCQRSKLVYIFIYIYIIAYNYKNKTYFLWNVLLVLLDTKDFFNRNISSIRYKIFISCLSLNVISKTLYLIHTFWLQRLPILAPVWFGMSRHLKNFFDDTYARNFFPVKSRDEKCSWKMLCLDSVKLWDECSYFSLIEIFSEISS